MQNRRKGMQEKREFQHQMHIRKVIKALVDAFCLKIPITLGVLKIYFCEAKIIPVLARYYNLITRHLFSYAGA